MKFTTHHIIGTFLIFILGSCTIHPRFITKTSPSSIPSLVGTVKIDSNLFYDRFEISNMSWLEFLYWTSQVYGEESEEYKRLLPDINASPLVDTCNSPRVDVYLRHPLYRHFPVVGVTYDQALAFSNWRADRVMHVLLIEAGFLESNDLEAFNDTSLLFSISKLLDGKIKTKKPIEKIKYYPYYTLPSTEQWNKALDYNLSIIKSSNKRNERKVVNYDCNTYNSDTCIYNYAIYPKKIKLKYNTTKHKSQKAIYHLNDNLRELSNVKNTTMGYGWCDSTKREDERIINFNDSVNSNMTGFRNIGMWKEINN